MSVLSLETRLVLALNAVARTRAAAIVGFVSENGLYLFGAVGLLAFLRAKSFARADAGRLIVLAWFLAGLVAESVLKPLLHRSRPTGIAALRAQLAVLGPVPSVRSLGMPSGTAAMCAAGAMCIGFAFGRRAGIAAWIAAVLISLTRVIAGVHWPTDVLVGIGVGVATALAMRKANERVGKLGAAGPQ